MILARCHTGCSQSDVIAAMRSMGALGPGVSDQETLAILKAKPHGKYAMALCPAHNDRNPSLSLTITADTREVFVPWGDPIAVYRYRDEAGAVLFEFVRRERYVSGKREKQLRPRLPGASHNGIGDVRRVVYNLPEVLANQLIFIAEGERDCDALTEHGFVATTSPFGALKFRSEYAEWFRGKDAVILPDADAPGRAHAVDVARKLHGIAASLAVVELPGAKDAAEWFGAGHSEVEFIEILEREAFV